MKKRMMRKAGCLLLVLLLAALLCACAKEPAAETEQTAAEETAQSETVPETTAGRPEKTEPATEPETEPATEPEPTTEPETEPDPEPVITEGKHPREEGFSAAFDVYTLTDGSLTVHMHKLIYDEDQLRAEARHIRQDLEVLRSCTGEAEVSLEVYVVPHIVETNSRVIGTRVFCTPEDLETGAYRTDLVRAVCGLQRNWQIAGLTGYIFGEPADEAALRDWYRDGAHGDQLSLAPMYFFPGLAEEVTLRMSEDTARSVTEDYIAREGYEAFRALEHTADAVSPWAETVLGCEAPVLPEGSEEVDRLTVVFASEAQMILKADEEMNRFRWSLSKTDWVPDADTAYRVLCGFYQGYWPLLENMKAGLSDVFSRVRENAEQEITIEFIHSDNLSTASWVRNRISLSFFNACWHEMVHQLLPVRNWSDLEPRWEAEGLADYYSLPIETEYGWLSEGRVRYLTDDAYYQELFRDTEADDLTLRELFLQNYTAVCPLPLEGEKLDQVWYSRSAALATLLHPELKETKGGKSTRSLADIAGFRAGSKDRDGNGLTYEEAELMMKYLMDRFGEEAVVGGYLDGQSPTAQFGVSYEELFADFLDWVRAEFPSAE